MSEKLSKIANRRAALRSFRSKHRNRTLKQAADALLRHPVTLLLLGFVLTAVVGSSIQRYQIEADKERTELYEASGALSLISKAMLEYQVRVGFAVRSGSTDDKLKMEEAFLRLVTALSAELEPALRPFSRDDEDGVLSSKPPGLIASSPAQAAFAAAIIGFARTLPPLQERVEQYLAKPNEMKKGDRRYPVESQVKAAYRCLLSLTLPVWASLASPPSRREADFMDAANSVAATWKTQADAGNGIAESVLRDCPLIRQDKSLSNPLEILIN